ncbi:pentaheme c-type cytochrome TorC [Enterovibrio nigricans]|uniref:Cytochrome c-type protein n=1 Tax=Enterovibrio nigricans DSM 22720 TaxID=1121868 RepID=A0A1T4VTY6_9GAMM|nr:pentaheme c-type cytochrome TorC [Enterovibrio nigricans]SKA68426.1 trimethylamine-N-oxide reductase (cytochrome c), cytochrome c-type subunit TorC [Enterovibrio nigricans DSM 22720]
MKVFIRKLWATLGRPATKISLGTLTLGGFIAGVIFWGGFNTALELTNTEKFCISCHSMRDNVYPELQKTVHWSNTSGVRATCPDCHVPHNWTDKIARKMQASKEVFAQIFGVIGTREKFLDKRLELAQHEWARFSANGSMECKACHKYESMQIENMRPAARIQMAHAAKTDQSCIDCHKGIAHQLPAEMDSTGGMLGKLLSLSHSTSYDKDKPLYSVNFLEMYTDDALKNDGGVLEPATMVTVIDDKDDAIKISLTGWRKMKGFGRVVYEDFGLNIPSAALSKAVAQSQTDIRTFETKDDDLTGLTWQRIEVDLWAKKADFVESIDPVWTEAKQAYETNCSLCHTQPDVAHFDANTWPGMFDGMMGFVNFDQATQVLVLKYLQKHSSTFAEH